VGNSRQHRRRASITDGAGGLARRSESSTLLWDTKSNRDGIGARIKLVTKSGPQYNHMTTSMGYASSSDGPVHFGLGAEARAESITIYWPSGAIQTLENVSGDQVLKVTEPLH